MSCKLSEKRQNWRNSQVKARIRAISDRPAPDYPDVIDHKEYWDDIEITRHTPYGEEKIHFRLQMSHKRIDSCLVIHNGYLVMGDNKRPQQMGMYRALNYIANVLGRRGRFDE